MKGTQDTGHHGVQRQSWTPPDTPSEPQSSMLLLFTPGFSKVWVCGFVLCGLLNSGVAFLMSVLRHQQEQRGDTLWVLQSERHLAGAQTLPETLSCPPPLQDIQRYHHWQEAFAMGMFSYKEGVSRQDQLFHPEVIFSWSSTFGQTHRQRKTPEFCPSTMIWVWMFLH